MMGYEYSAVEIFKDKYFSDFTLKTLSCSRETTDCHNEVNTDVEKFYFLSSWYKTLFYEETPASHASNADLRII